jgi:hypothetical protein
MALDMSVDISRQRIAAVGAAECARKGGNLEQLGDTTGHSVRAAGMTISLDRTNVARRHVVKRTSDGKMHLIRVVHGRNGRVIIVVRRPWSRIGRLFIIVVRRPWSRIGRLFAVFESLEL